MSNANRKYFVHIDGDSFFAACEIAARPYLRGKPVVVGEERGIATAMSKEAKAIGIVRGDPIFKIKKEFPTVHIIQSHFDLYEKYCKNLFDLLKEVTDNVECYSIDENYIPPIKISF
jgi:nucleotidyltransferase/DNA polymerase involved in DNA repair